MENFRGLVGIIAVDLLLSGDNALVIALASRRLPKQQQKLAIICGGLGAIVARVLLIFGATYLLTIPYLQLSGGLVLFWVAAKLMSGKRDTRQNVEAAPNLLGAVKTIVVSDVIMSLDNVLAVAGVAKGNFVLLAFGIALSIPIILWGSKIIIKFMERWPIIIVLGAAFLGFTAGELAVADRSVAALLVGGPWSDLLPPAFAAGVIILGRWRARRRSNGQL